MLLDDLVGTIETLKQRIATHEETLSGYEIRTRMALIDPLLQTLGWDTSDPDMVAAEFPILKGRADYAFLSMNGQPVSVLEAKKLGEGLETHNSQMINYALQLGVDYAGLTDGDQWHIYDLTKSGALPNRRILNVSIREEPAHEAALKLLLLWRTNLASGHPAMANAPEVYPVHVEQSEPTPPIKPVPDYSPPVHEPLSDWTPLTDIHYTKGDKSPVVIKFPSGETALTSKWVNVWFEVCEWLVQNGKLSEKECPVPSPIGNGVRVLVNTTAQHPASSKNPNGRDFAQSQQTSKGLFVETNYSPKDSIRNAIFLLDRLGVSSNAVELRFD